MVVCRSRSFTGMFVMVVVVSSVTAITTAQLLLSYCFCYYHWLLLYIKKRVNWIIYYTFLHSYTTLMVTCFLARILMYTFGEIKLFLFNLSYLTLLSHPIISFPSHRFQVKIVIFEFLQLLFIFIFSFLKMGLPLDDEFH